MTKNENGIFEVYPTYSYKYKMKAAKELAAGEVAIINGWRAVIKNIDSGFNIDKIYGKELNIRYVHKTGCEYECFTNENVPFCVEI